MPEVLEKNLADTIKTASVDARWVIAHAAKRGIKLEVADIDTLTNAIAKIDAGQLLEPADQSTFWQALGKASTAVFPASLESWRYIYVEDLEAGGLRWIWRKIRGRPLRLSQGELMVSKYRGLTVLALVLLLLCQIYWLIGWTITKEMGDLQKETLPLVLKLFLPEAEQGPDGKSPASADGRTVTPNNGENTAAELRLRLENFDKRAEADLKILISWNNTWQSILAPVRPLTNGALTLKEAPDADLDTDEFAELPRASFALQSLSAYLLPLLYGWLGALAYTLRSLEADIRDITLRRIAQVGYGLRLTLGAVAGLAIGWFFKANDATIATAIPTVNVPAADVQGGLSIGSISFLALAFVAGYSVDLLFTALDRIVTAFGSKASAPKPP